MSVPDQFDLILVSDSGKTYLVKMTPVGEGHEPTSVEPLDPVLDEVPSMLRDEGVTLAVMPDEPSGGGCTCTLLNLQSIKASLRPQQNPNLKALIKARDALRKGGTISIKPADGGQIEEIKGKPHR